MPELPEVETLRRELARVLPGLQIKSAEGPWPFMDDLIGEKITGVGRRAKILILELDGPAHLLIHLKMTGQLIFESPEGKSFAGGHPEADPFKYTRATLHFAGGSKLFFNDLRKFGWWKLLPQSEAGQILEKHGVEPLTKNFTLAKFQEIIARYPHRQLKQLLLDQTLIAGLGNIYVDEACFLAKVRPTRRANNLTRPEQKQLHASIIKVLKHSINKGGTSARNYRRSDGRKGGFVKFLNVYGRKGAKCKRCKKEVINKIKLAGRGTHFCPRCQK